MIMDSEIETKILGLQQRLNSLEKRLTILENSLGGRT